MVRTQIDVRFTEWEDRNGIDYWVYKEVMMHDTNTYECVFRVNESSNTKFKETALNQFTAWINEAKAIPGIKMIDDNKLSQARENINDLHWITFEM